MGLSQFASALKAFAAIQVSDPIKPIREAFSLCSDGLTYLDVGAAYGIKARWSEVEEYINFVGIEPDSRTQKSVLKHTNYRSSQFHPVFAWSANEKIQFHSNVKPGVSSVYEANLDFLQRYPGFQRFSPANIISTDGSALDSVIHNTDIDFIKLDIQGGELEALKGMPRLLDRTLGLDIEVEFSQMYKNQPLYGDVNKFLTDKGFEFIDFINLARWERKDHNKYGQLIFGDGLWMKSPESIFTDRTDKNKIFAYLAICALHGRLDLIERGIDLGYPIDFDYRPLWLKLVRNQVRTRKVFNEFREFFKNVDPYGKPHLIY